MLIMSTMSCKEGSVVSHLGRRGRISLLILTLVDLQEGLLTELVKPSKVPSLQVLLAFIAVEEADMLVLDPSHAPEDLALHDHTVFQIQGDVAQFELTLTAVHTLLLLIG